MAQRLIPVIRILNGAVRRLLAPDQEDTAGNDGSLVEALHNEVDRQRADLSGRATSVATRASLLVASASIITSLQASGGGLAFSLSLLASAGAAVAGVIALVMWRGDELSIQQLETDLWPMGKTDALRDLLYQKLYILRKDEKQLARRAFILNVGFCLLTAALIAATIHLVLGKS